MAVLISPVQNYTHVPRELRFIYESLLRRLKMRAEQGG